MHLASDEMPDSAESGVCSLDNELESADINQCINLELSKIEPFRDKHVSWVSLPLPIKHTSIM